MKPTKKQHEAGVKRLNKIFGWSPTDALMFPSVGGGKKGAAKKRQKQARKSRKRNRR